jgi:hypothetical protein
MREEIISILSIGHCRNNLDSGKKCWSTEENMLSILDFTNYCQEIVKNNDLKGGNIPKFIHGAYKCYLLAISNY